jgi:hypothetical protein
MKTSIPPHNMPVGYQELACGLKPFPLTSYHFIRGGQDFDLSLWSPARIASAWEPILPLASNLTANLLHNLVDLAMPPAMIFFDVAICFMHSKPFHDYYRPVHHLGSVPASSARWIEFTILDGNSSASLVPREGTGTALALHFQLGERKNGIWEFHSQEPSELRY